MISLVGFPRLHFTANDVHDFQCHISGFASHTLLAKALVILEGFEQFLG